MTETTTVSLDELRAAHLRDYDHDGGVSIADNMIELAERNRVMPVSYSSIGNGFWVLTGYDDCASVLRRNNKGVISFPNDPQGIVKARPMVPIEIDGKEHRDFRALLEPVFAPKRIMEMEERLTRWCNQLIDQFIEDGHVDLIEKFALPFPGATVMAIMGWPMEDLEQMNEWTDAVLHGIPGASLEENTAHRVKGYQEMAEYMVKLIEKRRSEPPRDDVTGALLEVEMDGKKLSEDDLLGALFLMMTAGLDTVQSLLTGSMAYFAEHQDQWAELDGGDEIIDAAAEEMLRWVSPAPPNRVVVEDNFEVGDIELPKGERIHLVLGQANRDPEYYPEPDKVKFDRGTTKPHMAFGMGPHRCIGVHLARLEIRIAFRELRRRIPTFRLDPDKEISSHLGFAWGLGNVHLQFEPGPRESEGPAILD